jgi:hypothetical protein
MRFAMWAALAGMVIFVGCGGQATVQTGGQPVKLEYKDLGGQPLGYRADLSVTSDVGGRTRTWLSTFDFDMKTDEIAADGSIRRSFEFGDFSVTTVSGGTPEPDPNAAGYKDETLWFEMDPDGELVDWKGLDMIRGRLVGGPRFKDAIVYVYLRVFSPMPDEPVNAGSSWQRTFKMPLGMMGSEVTFRGTADYVVGGFGTRQGRECVKIKTSVRIDGESDRKVGEEEELAFVSEEQGDGEIWFDSADGVIVEYSIKTSATYTMRQERAGKTDVATDFASVDSEIKIKIR